MSRNSESIKQEIIKKIHSAQSIAILVSDPDSDAIGSGLALEEILEQFGKKSYLYSSFDISDYHSLPRFNKFLVKDLTTIDFGQYEIIITLDSGDLSRVLDNRYKGKESELFKNSFIINIDHHATNTKFGTINYLDQKVSSTGEQLYDIFEKHIEFTPSLSTNILAAILGDTGCFRYPNTSPKTLRITANLIENGGDHQGIIKYMYYSFSNKTVQMNIEAIKTLNVRKNGDYRYSYAIVDGKKFQDNQVTRPERYLAQEVVRSIKDIDFSVIITTYQKGFTKLSFRAGDREVDKIAEHFEGGGHAQAAGGITKADPEKFLEDLDTFLKKTELKKTKTE